jgi:hypothetical protein
MAGAIPSVARVLSSGYTTRTALNQLKRIYPHLSKGITTLSLAGYATNTILRQALFPKGPPREDVGSEESKTHKEYNKTRKSENRIKAGAAATAIGALGLYRFLGTPASQLPEWSGETIDVEQQEPLRLENKQNVDTSLPSQPITAPPSPKDLEATQAPLTKGITGLNPRAPLGPQDRPKDPFEEAKKLGIHLREESFPQISEKVTRDLSKGMSPESIYEGLKKSPTYSPLINGIEKQQGRPYSERIKELHEKVNEKFKPSVGAQVITPDGEIGDIAHIRNKHGLIKTPGRLESDELSKLKPVPEEWKHVHVDLSEVPEEDRSSNLNLVFAEPDDKGVYVQFWEGKTPQFYRYRRKDGQSMTQDLLESLSKETDEAKTEGENFYGAWESGGKSRGSAFYHRLKMLSQWSEDEKQKEDKPYIFDKVPISWEHGYLKLFKKKTKEANERFKKERSPKRR